MCEKGRSLTFSHPGDTDLFHVALCCLSFPCVRLSEFEAVKFSKFALSKKTKKKKVDRIVLDISLWRQTETFSEYESVINIDKPESFSKGGGRKFTATVAKSKERSC